MGAGQSLPSNLTHEKLFELTKSTRNVMDILLNYMLKEVTVRDFLSLSNPAECKKYVLFKANTLYKYFYELKITPVRDEKSREGMIAFRPVRELIAPPSAEEEKERQTLCLILAYYYTRIFQIYGALALTLIDDMETAVKSGLMTTLTDDKKRLLAPGQRTYRTYGGLSGGAINYPQLQVFYFLRSFLLDQQDVSKGFRTIYVGDENSRAEIYFKRPSVTTLDEQNRRAYEVDSDKVQKGIFTIGYYGAKNYATLEVFAKKESIGSTNIKFEFGKIKYTKKGSSDTSSSDIPTQILSKKTLTIISESSVGSRQPTQYFIKDTENEEIAPYFIAFFNKLVPFIKALVEGDETIVTKYNVDGARVPSETGVTEELKLAKTIQNLTRVKPYGHCIARALQLLKSAPFKDQPGFSSVCKARFIESVQTTSNGQKTVVSRSGIPIAGSPLDTSPGMAALAQLFYDTIQGASIKIGESKGPDGKSTLDQYIQFMSNMATLFGDSKNRTPESYKTGLKGIINKRDDKLCITDSGKITGDITLPNNVSRKVYEYVQKLFQIQYQHAGKCGGIFKQLFNIKTDKGSNRFEISLSDNILKKGFPEIERINSEARKLLIDYYSKCEQTYVIAMDLVVGTAKKSTITPTPTTVRL